MAELSFSMFPFKKSVVISKEMMMDVFNIHSHYTAEGVVDAFNKAFSLYNVVEPIVAIHILAQAGYESEGFTKTTFNFKLSPSELAKLCPACFSVNKSKRIRQPNLLSYRIKNNQNFIANNMYANILGNRGVDSGDGWRNRGGGYILLNGATIWYAYSDYKGVPIGEIQDWVRCTKMGAADSACWYFLKMLNLEKYALDDDLLMVTLHIDKKRKGLLVRHDHIERMKRFFSIDL